MNNWTSPRPSMIDLGKKSKVALLAGCGGGGDIFFFKQKTAYEIGQ